MYALVLQAAVSLLGNVWVNSYQICEHTLECQCPNQIVQVTWNSAGMQLYRHESN